MMHQSQPKVGEPVQLEDGVTCVLAPNASPMTYWGTNSYLLGHDTIALIDPGPDDPAHAAALLGAINGRRVSHILITHSHLDHSPLARRMSQAVDAPVLAFGDSSTGRSDVMKDLAASGLMGGGEGVDSEFQPDEILNDGDDIPLEGFRLTAHHTPGHFGNHMCFTTDRIGFSGDLVMGWATSLVSPPDGDLTDFMASCRKLAATGIRRAYAGHGAPIPDAQARIAEILRHRLSREHEILNALEQGAAPPKHLTQLIYDDVPKALLGMAERNVLAHLVDLTQRGQVAPLQRLSAVSHFTLK